MQQLAKQVLEKNGIPLGVLVKNIVDTPEVTQKMRNYINLFGFTPSDNRELLPLQVYNIQQTIRNTYKKKARKNYLNESDFNRYVGSDSFEKDYQNFENEMEAQQGFEGFDGDGFDNLLPIAALGGSLLKKGIGAIGKKLKEKAGAKAQKDTSVKKIDKSIKEKEGVKQLINNGLTEAQVKEGLLQISKKETAEARKGNRSLIAEDRRGTSRVVDLLNKTVADYKTQEENKAIRDKIPTIVGVALVIGVIGYFLGKK